MWRALVIAPFAALAACGGPPSLLVAPGDSWSCDCACDDPAVAGATITVPLHGCAPTGTDPADPDAVAKVCPPVCDVGTTPQLGPDAAIGACLAVAAGAKARLVAPHTCDPADTPLRAAAPVDAGEYHVSFDAGRSSMTLHAGGLVATRPVRGGMYFELDSGTPTAIGILDLELAADDFSTDIGRISELRIADGEQTGGMIREPPTFTIYNGLGVLAARWRRDGEAQGINAVNRDKPWVGTIDLAAGRVVIDLSGSDPSYPDATTHTLSAHLEGTIDNHPPVADAGPAQQTVSCSSRAGTPVTLDASSSSDPDPGDAIVHYQWFTQYGMGLGNQPMLSSSVPIGTPREFVLKVYDRHLAAAVAATTVTVTDTTPPCP